MGVHKTIVQSQRDIIRYQCEKTSLTFGEGIGLHSTDTERSQAIGGSVPREHAERLISPFLKDLSELPEGVLFREPRKDEGLPSPLDPCVQGFLCVEAFRCGRYWVFLVIDREPRGAFR